MGWETTAAVLHAYMTSLQELENTGDTPEPPQVSPSAYEIGFGQLADPEVYHEIAKRWRAVTRPSRIALTKVNCG